MPQNTDPTITPGSFPKENGKDSRAEACTDLISRKTHSQRTWRAREKERKQNARCLLLDTQNHLQEVEKQRSTLEARNKVLSQYIFAGHTLRSPGAHVNVTSVTLEAKHVPHVIKSLLLPVVKLTSQTGNVHYLTPDIIAQLPNTKLADLYTEAHHQICTAVQGASDPDTYRQLYKSTTEATCLILSHVMCNPGAVVELSKTSMADGSLNAQSIEDPAGVCRLVSFGENQLQDLLTLRRLFLGRLGSLLSERKKLMYQISQHRDQSDKVQYWAAQLEQNIVQEHQTYLQNSTAQYLGIYTAFQLAVGIVAAYPFWPNQNVLEDVAVQRGEPSLGDIVSQRYVPHDTLTWRDVKLYANTITDQNMFAYVPFVSSHRSRLLQNH